MKKETADRAIMRMCVDRDDDDCWDDDDGILILLLLLSLRLFEDFVLLMTAAVIPKPIMPMTKIVG